MSFADWSNQKMKKKEQFAQGQAVDSQKNLSAAPAISFADWSNENHPVEEEDIAPVEKDGEKWYEGWFQRGDEDVAKTILGTTADATTDVTKGGVGILEGVIDWFASQAPNAILTQSQHDNPVGAAGAYLGRAISNLIRGDDINHDPTQETNDRAYAQAVKDATEFIKKDIIDEEAVSKEIVSRLGSAIYMYNATGGGTGFATPEQIAISQQMQQDTKKYMDTEMEEDSVFAHKMDELMESAGQLAGTAAISATGIPWWAVSGATAWGGEVESALQQGATLEEANLSGMISAGAEVLTEQISGGIKFGGKTLDDALTKRLAANISSKFWRNAAKLGIDMTGEGIEEVLSEDISRFGQWLTYQDEKTLVEMLWSEEAMDAKIQAFMSGAALGGSGSVTNTVKSAVTGVDAVSGLTKNEQAVVERIVEDEASKAENKGKSKTEIYDRVVKDMERGYISTETIESVLGKDALAQYDALSKEAEEFKTLYETEGGKLSEKQKDRLAELKEKNKANPYEDLLKSQRAKISKDVSTLAQSDRLGESYAEQIRKNEKFQADVSKYSEAQRKTVQNAIDSGILNNTNRSHEFVDLIAKISADKGISFDFADNAKLKESGFALDGVLVNGFVNENGVTINIQSAKALNRVVGHEITHVLEGTELYNALQSAVTEYAKGKKEYDSRLKELTELYKGKNANVEQELVADLVGDYLFTDADFIRHLSTEHRNLFQKIYDEIKYLCKIVTAGTKEARQLEKVKKAFADAYRAETKNPTTEGGTKYSLNIKHTDGSVEVLADARNLTTEQAVSYLQQAKAGTLRRDTYIPVRKDTPQVIIDTLEQVNEHVENCSLVMQVDKAQQSMKAEKTGRRVAKYGSNVRGHALSAEQIVEILNKLDDPSMIVYQTNRHDVAGNLLPNNVVVIVEYSSNETEGVAVIEFDSSFKQEVIGREFGDVNYHTVVTVFEPDVMRDDMEFDYAEELLSNPDNIELKIERRQPKGSATGANQPNTSNELPYSDSIRNPNGEVNTKFSLITDKRKAQQFDIVLENNPMWDDYHVGIRSVEDIRTWEEVLELDDEREGQFVWGDFSREDAENALKNNSVTVYSSHPISNGTFVSTSYTQAWEYAGGNKNSKVYSKEVPLEDVAWINGDEGQYARVEDGQGVNYSLSKKDFSIAPPVGADVHGKDIGYDIAPPIPESVPRANKARPKVGDPAYAPIAEKYLPKVNPEDSTGAAPSGFDPVSHLQYEYGSLPEGEKPVREDSLPKSTNGKDKVSLTARTVKGAEATPDALVDLLDKTVVEGGLSYIPLGNDATVQKAYDRITNLGWEEALADWKADVHAGKVSAELSATGALLLNNAANAGDRAVWLDVLHEYQRMGTSAAQAVQALRILKTLAPEDKLYMIHKSVDQMNRDSGYDVEVDEDLLHEWDEAETDAERDEVLDAIMQNVANQIPATFMEKFTALRYVNMLGNLRTQVRNVAGNLSMKGVRSIHNTIATGLEAIADTVSGGKTGRTRAVTVSKEQKVAAKNDFEKLKSMILDGGKYSYSVDVSTEFAKGVQEKRKIFKFKPLEGYRKATNWAMEQGDLIFARDAYARSLAGYLKANGITETDYSKIDTKVLENARLFAIKEAQEATFRDTNTLSGWISKVGRRRDTHKVGKLISEGVLPFRKTPANVLIRAEEYSPLGIINSVYYSVKAMQKSTDITATQVINSWAKSLTGTGLFALGMLLQSVGCLAGGADDDESKDKFDSMNGWQNYAIVLPDGTNLTIDFLTPTAMPLLMGAELSQLMADDGFELQDLESALTSITEPMVQMSMLQGINDTLDNVKYSDNSLMQMALNSGLSYVTQGLTNTLLGQVERAFEDSHTTTYVDKDSAIPDWLQRTIGKVSAKIPGLDYNQIPYINAWGEEEEYDNVASNLAYNMLSPSYVDKGKEDAVSKELLRLNEVQSENVFPNTPAKSLSFTDVNNESHKNYQLSAEEYVALAKTQGQKQRELVEAAIATTEYGLLSDTEKATVIKNIYKYAKEYARGKVIEGYADDYGCFSSKWMSEIYGDVAEEIIWHTIDQRN